VHLNFYEVVHAVFLHATDDLIVVELAGVPPARRISSNLIDANDGAQDAQLVLELV